MLGDGSFSPEDLSNFKEKAFKWAASFETACYFDSNGYSDPYSAFDVLIAAGTQEEIRVKDNDAFATLAARLHDNVDWLLGFLAYDLKNEIEALTSSNPDYLQFPNLYFFKPLHLLLIKNGTVQIQSPTPDKIINEIQQTLLNDIPFSFDGEIKGRFSRDEYNQTVLKLKKHIRQGNIYEVNLCQEFYSEDHLLDTVEAFNALNKISPTPFATFFKHKEHEIICATPERFLSRRENKLISQPIKGTIKRSENIHEDLRLKEALRANPKEQAENVMIVDLVRNDLTRCALPGSVKVEELFGIYSFEQVHQMISTVVCEVRPGMNNAEIIRSVFPMGSMTGAPKIAAMELIEKYEKSRRGIFSGAVGYFAPTGDFDFNVVIRTLLYNSEKKYLSFHVGSAITFESDADAEYEECLLKAEAIKLLLSPKSPREHI